MFVLGLSGSPRRHANSETLLDEALSGAAGAGAETEKLVASRFKKLLPCVSCGHCLTAGTCRVQDEMQEVYPRLDRADGLIIASPVYFMGVSAFLKILIDRCQCYWSRKYILHQPAVPGSPGRVRKGIFLATAGHDKPAVFSGARMTVKALFDVLEISWVDEYCVNSMEEPKDILQVQGGLAAARSLGERLVNELREGRP